jgi:hypothetical protein
MEESQDLTTICPNGHSMVGGRFCTVCGAALGADHRTASSRPPSTPEEFPRLVVPRLNVLDGAGWAPRIGSRIALFLYNVRFDLRESSSGTVLSSVELRTLEDVRIEGQSLRTGGRFIGGGFGAKGAIEGMAISTVLNKVTTKTHQWVTVDLVAEGGWVQFQLDGAEAFQIRDRLRVLSDEVVLQRSERAKALVNEQIEQPPAAMDLVSSLERLAALRDKGALTEDEFMALKAKVILDAST